MVERVLIVPDAAAMRALGAALGRLLPVGACLRLSGPLGAGKTTFTQGLGQGLGVAGPVISPTFTLIREHPGPAGRPGLVHMDFYRLAGDAEARDLAVDDYLGGADVVAIEWPERAPAVTAGLGLDIHIQIVGEARHVTLSAHGGPAETALAGLVPPRGVEAA